MIFILFANLIIILSHYVLNIVTFNIRKYQLDVSTFNYACYNKKWFIYKLLF